MRQKLCLILCLILTVSSIPAISFQMPVSADEGNSGYGLYDNPIVISETNNTVVYEAENYPLSQSNYRYVEDPEASNGGALTFASALPGRLGTIYAYPGENVQYKLWIRAEQACKIQIFARAKTRSGLIQLATSKNDYKTAAFASVEEVLNVYHWNVMYSYSIEKDELFCINIAFITANTTVDSFLITTDMLYFPTGTGENHKTIELGVDSTDYENLMYPLPPFTPINSHPRVLINSNMLDDIRARLEYDENRTVYEQLVAFADTYPTEDQWKVFESSSGYLWANAFLYALNHDYERGKAAVDGIFKLFDTAKVGDQVTNSNRRSNSYKMLVVAIVYDWCYDLLDYDQKYELIETMMFCGTSLEIKYPPKVHGRNNGHESEGDIFVSMLSAAIACYGDFNEMYNIVGGKIFEEMLDTRNYYYEMGNHGMGTNYTPNRLVHECYLKGLLDAGVTPGLVDKRMEDLFWDFIYSVRPDNFNFTTGDASIGDYPTLRMNRTSLFFAANMFKNPYLRNQYIRTAATSTFTYSLSSVNHVLWLIYNDPRVGRKSYKELPLTRFYGKNAGLMICRTGWTHGVGNFSNDMVVRLNLETIDAGSHGHLDKGHFDIYYKGGLALDTGTYHSEPFNDENGNPVTNLDFGSAHDTNYFKRTIAHNSMLIYDPNEPTDPRWPNSGVDGGQRAKISNSKTMEYLREQQKIGDILAVDYGEDMYAPAFSYMKGDMKPAYSDYKLESYTRSFVFMNFFDNVYPGALVVFDKVVSSDPSYKKTWLLHTHDEPQVEEGRAMVDNTYQEGYNGRLVNDTLLPAKDNRTITKVGGPDNEFTVNGKNYKAVIVKPIKEYGQWRIELSPATPSKEDYFLNVLQVSDANDSIAPLETELIEAGDFVGAKIKDRVAFFCKQDKDYTKDINFTLTGEGEFNILVTGVKRGNWNVYKNGVLQQVVCATENGKDFIFNGTAGQYTLKKNIRCDRVFVRNLNFLDYIRPLGSDYKHLRFNSAYYDINFMPIGEKLFIEADKIVKLSNGEYEIDDDSVIFKAGAAMVDIPFTDERIRNIDGIYYVDIDALSTLYKLKWKTAYGYIYDVTGGLKRTDFIAIDEEGYATVIDAYADEGSSNPENPVSLTLDRVTSTLWNNDIIGAYIVYTFDRTYLLDAVDIMFSISRTHYIEVHTSTDGINFTKIYDAWTPDTNTPGVYQTLDMPDTLARYVKIVAKGNGSGRPQWVGINEIRFPIIEGDYEPVIPDNIDDMTDIEDEFIDESFDDISPNDPIEDIPPDESVEE